MKGAARQTFRALSSRNYRLYFFGQIVSVSGTWMQTVALGWLVLQLTGSGTWLGLVIACQFLPMLVLAPMGGVVADRVDKRRFLFLTQAASGLLALSLGVLVLGGAVQLWMVFAFALALGTVNAFDMPARQTFVFEMVGPDLLTNAVTLNSVVMNGARVVGPAIAGIVIASAGVATCFVLNGVSYAACIVGLALMHTSDLVPVEARPHEKGQLRAGLRYVWGEPALRTPLLLLAAIGTLTYEFQISLPLIAQQTFGAGAEGYGVLTSAMGAGAVVGGLVAANRARPTRRRLGVAAMVFGAMVLIASVAPTFGAMVLVLPVVGAASVTFIALSNTNLQLAARPEMRGRVMALYSVAIMGSTPIGGPIVGWVGQAVGARAALVLGGVTAVTAAALAWRSLNRSAPVDVVLDELTELDDLDLDGELARLEHDALVEAEVLDAAQMLGDDARRNDLDEYDLDGDDRVDALPLAS